MRSRFCLASSEVTILSDGFKINRSDEALSHGRGDTETTIDDTKQAFMDARNRPIVPYF